MNPEETETKVEKLRRAKVVYHRVIVQGSESDPKAFTIVEDLGATSTAKAVSKAKKLTKAGQKNLAVVYWVG